MSLENADDLQEEAAIPVESADPQLVQEFMEITGCNQRLSESIMSSHSTIEAAIGYFYGVPENAPKFDTEQEAALQFQGEYVEVPVATVPGEYESPETADDITGLEISLTSWNIDGLDTSNRSARFQACYYVLKRIAADFIFLQEVVSATDEIFKKLESHYRVFCSDRDAPYYTAILVTKEFEVISHQVINYTNSGMGRTLQIVEGRLGPLTVFLLNTHLESMAEHSAIRREQFRFCMNKIREMITKNPGCLLYFGGDLNARDKEVQEDASCIPKGLADTWMAVGSSIQTRYTFDMTQNDNKRLGKARCRFDRIYFYGPLHASSFELDGKQRIRTSLCFPSDHWAINCVFKA